MLNIKVDQNNCIGCGMCVNTYPAIFEFEENFEFAKVKLDINQTEIQNNIDEICSVCPVGAISSAPVSTDTENSESAN